MSIPVLELWRGLHPDGLKGTFGVVIGHIDESYDSNIFTLCCVLGSGETWYWLEQEWLQCLEGKNQALKTASRPPLRRYHATDCLNMKNEFKGWSVGERDDFVKSLTGTIRGTKAPLMGFAKSINLKELTAAIPQTADDPVGHAYGLMFSLILYDIGEACEDDLRISLIIERSRYDVFLGQCFKNLKEDPTFRFAKHFLALTPMGWEDCAPLQPTDLIAFETFRNVKKRFRREDGARRRGRPAKKKSRALESLLLSGALRGQSEVVRKEFFPSLRKVITKQWSELLKITAKGKSEFERFNNVMGTLLSVSKEEMDRRITADPRGHARPKRKKRERHSRNKETNG